MVVSRSPQPLSQPVRRSPLAKFNQNHNHSVSEASFSSAKQASQNHIKLSLNRNDASQHILSTPAQASSLYPSLPRENHNHNSESSFSRNPPVVNEFPSLDEMAKAGREERERAQVLQTSSSSSAAKSKGFTVSGASSSFKLSSSSTSSQVPSSVPRPIKTRIGSLYQSHSDKSNQLRRSSLTAMEQARNRAGSATPLAISQAKTSRQASVPDTLDQSLGDDGDSTAQFVTGPDGATIMNMSIDVESGRIPALASTSTTAPMPTANPNQQSSSAPDVADISSSSQNASSRRRTSNERSASSGYNFSRYLDGEHDPFNAAKRNQMRRESRPLPVPPPEDDDDDEDGSDGDDTARAIEAPHSSMHQNQVVVENETATNTQAETIPKRSQPPKASGNGNDLASMPPPSFVPPTKPDSTAQTFAMPMLPPPLGATPKATPKLGSHKLNHLAGFNTSALGSATADESQLLSSAQKHRLDPVAQNDRLMSLELADLRKKHAALSKDHKALQNQLAASEEQCDAMKEESEGWASECTSLEEKMAQINVNHENEMEELDKLTAELELKVIQQKLDSDERQWKAINERSINYDLQVDLIYCKNEATYQSYRCQEVEADFQTQTDQLRIRFMAERKRCDVLESRLKASLKQLLRLKKKGSTKTSAFDAVENENQRLAVELEQAQQEIDQLNKQNNRNTQAGAGELVENRKQVIKLKKEVEKMRKELESHEEKQEMMAETRKEWKRERNELLAQVKELQQSVQISNRPKPNRRLPVQEGTEADGDQDEDEDDAASEVATQDETVTAATPPRSAAYANKGRRKPMQGASEAGPSEADLPLQSSPIAKAVKSKAPNKPSLAKAVIKKEAARNVSTKTKSSAHRREDELSDDYSASSASEGDDYEVPVIKRKATTASSKGPTNAKATKSRPAAAAQPKKSKVNAPMEYDDQTADPSATPMIRTKRAFLEVDQDPNDTQTRVAINPAEEQQQKKKKRKFFLGGNKAAAPGLMNWGMANGAADSSTLQPDYDIPLELSPIKQNAATGARPNSKLLAGFGLGGRGPFG